MGVGEKVEDAWMYDNLMDTKGRRSERRLDIESVTHPFCVYPSVESLRRNSCLRQRCEVWLLRDYNVGLPAKDRSWLNT